MIGSKYFMTLMNKIHVVLNHLVKQPEIAQRVDLMLRYMNVDRTESNSTGSCPGEERKHNREVQNLQVFAFLRVLTVRNSQKQHRELI